jgi:hypothetical protein
MGRRVDRAAGEVLVGRSEVRGDWPAATGSAGAGAGADARQSAGEERGTGSGSGNGSGSGCERTGKQASSSSSRSSRKRKKRLKRAGAPTAGDLVIRVGKRQKAPIEKASSSLGSKQAHRWAMGDARVWGRATGPAMAPLGHQQPRRAQRLTVSKTQRGPARPRLLPATGHCSVDSRPPTLHTIRQRLDAGMQPCVCRAGVGTGCCSGPADGRFCGGFGFAFAFANNCYHCTTGTTAAGASRRPIST